MANKPRIRFRGFTEDWEQRKLDDIAKIKTGGGTPKTANPEYWSGNIPWIQSSDLVEGDIVHVNINKFINNNALKNSAAKLISRDSIALVTRVGVGKVAVINQDFTTSQDFLSLSDFDGSDIKFLAYQLYRLMQENAKVLQGTSIKGITKTELIEQSISIPSSGQEQNLISAVLSKIDSIITLHQCKLKKLNLAKKSLLQKLFPRNGSQIPGVRFKGFTDAWEQRKLGDVAIITGGGTPSTNVPEYWNGDIDWYSPVEIGKNRYVSKSTRKITKLGLEKSSAKLLPIGTVLFTSRAGIGNTAILQAEGCTNQGFQSITPDSKELDTYFLYTMTPRLKRYGEVTGAGSTFVEVSGKQMEKMSLVLPSLEEQKQIGRFFRTIDDSITLHQRKLERLQEVKKGLLQKMFV
ncbi:restriction endonuclease subunit S [Veillonella parvula]|uniref:restriction endonuclease subunit S n=1 Tax=Veillonella parvula TaxID=29466 RepID=UPI0032C127C4